MNWIMENESKVFTLVKNATYAELSALYPTIVFTTIDTTDTDETHKQTVYIHELQGVEMAQDLNGNDVNAIVSTFEVQVACSTNRQDAIKIMDKILNQFKAMRFEIVATPLVTTKAAMFICNARFRRTIGSGDFDNGY